MQGDKAQVPRNQADRIERILDHLEVAVQPSDMSIPGYRLHALKGDKKGFWAVTVTGNWRIVFQFDEGDVTGVNLVDYH